MPKSLRAVGVALALTVAALLTACVPVSAEYLGAAPEDDYYEPDYEIPEPEPPVDDPPEPVQNQQPGGGIAWNEAGSHAWSYQRVCGPFAGWGSSDNDVFLNLGVDYPNPARFQIVLWDIEWFVPLPPLDATVCAEGNITLYEGVAQIELYDPTLVELYW